MIGPAVFLVGLLALLIFVWRRLRDRALTNVHAKAIKRGQGKPLDGALFAHYPTLRWWRR